MSNRVVWAQLLDDLPRLLATFAATTIIVTHDREDASWIADHMAVLVGGVVRAAGAIGEIVPNPPDRETTQLLGYTIVPLDGTRRGIPPGALRIGSGPGAFEVIVDRIIDMGNHRHLIGHTPIAVGSRIDVRLAPGAAAPAPGSLVSVEAGWSVPLR